MAAICSPTRSTSTSGTSHTDSPLAAEPRQLVAQHGTHTAEQARVAKIMQAAQQRFFRHAEFGGESAEWMTRRAKIATDARDEAAVEVGEGDCGCLRTRRREIRARGRLSAPARRESGNRRAA